MYSWVWAWTPGVIAQQHVRAPVTPVGVQRVQPVELVEAVDDDAAHPGLERLRSSSTLLLLPCIVHGAAGTPAASATCSSPPVATSSSRPSSYGEAGHRPAQERLGGVDDAAGAERVDRLPAAGAQVLLVVDEQRRAELGGQLVDAAPADGQRAVGGDAPCPAAGMRSSGLTPVADHGSAPTSRETLCITGPIGAS